MAARIEKILKNARLTLADPAKQRWSDDTLLVILAEAQEDFNQQTEFLHEQVEIDLNEGDPYFSLPIDCWKLTRVLYKDSSLPLVTHKELDELTLSRRFVDFSLPTGGSKWEATAGQPRAIVYDRRDFTQGKVYPIPKDLTTEPSLTSIYGVVSSNTNTLYGVAVELIDGAENITPAVPLYGVTSEVNTSEPLHCYYLKNPQEIVDIYSVLDIPPMYDIALKFYVCGQAFMNDLDVAYQQKGAAQMLIYERHVRQAKKTSSQDYIRAGAFKTVYRRGFGD